MPDHMTLRDDSELVIDKDHFIPPIPYAINIFQYQMAVLFYNYKSVSKVVSVWPENFKDAQNAVITLFPELAKCNFTIKSGDFPLGDEQEWIEFKKHVEASEIRWTKDIVTITISQ